jgi:hypothetical protein
MTTDEKVALGAQILKICLDYDSLKMQGKFNKPAVLANRVREILLENNYDYNPLLLDAMEHIHHEQVKWVTEYLHVRELKDFMVIDEDVKAKNNEVIVKRGQEVSETVLQVLNTYSRGAGVMEPFRVIVMKNN